MSEHVKISAGFEEGEGALTRSSLFALFFNSANIATSP